MSDEYGRPDGVDGSFAPRGPGERIDYRPPPPTQPPPDIEAAYSRSTPDTPAFDPPPSHRIAPSAAVVQAPVRPGDPELFGTTPAARDGFDPAPGDRIAPAGRPAPSPWWVEGAERDPWRNPSSPFTLGRPAVFVDGRPAPDLRELDDLDADDADGADDDADAKNDRKVVRGRFGLSGLLMGLVIALVAGALGGGVSYWLSDRANDAVTDAGVTLGTSGQPANRPPGSVADLAQRVTPAVVSIEVRTGDALITGSGVVIAKVGDGSYVLTNNHVVSAAAAGSSGGGGGGSDGTSGASITVTYSDSATAPARIVGRDTLTDLAVIKSSRTDVTVASLGNSDQLAVGDPVIAIGSPLGLSGSVTSGIVSALHRPVKVSGEGTDTNAVIDAIQTDAAVNVGNSGGPLIDASGAVIGINSAIASLSTSGTGGSIGVGFAIPVNSARTVAQQLIQTGQAVHASLGVNARSVTDGSRDGAYVVQVVPGGPAAAAGLKEGDVIVKLGDLSIGSSDELIVAVQQHDPGENVTLTFFRGGSQSTATATLGRA